MSSSASRRTSATDCRPKRARREAHRQFGSVTRARERTREADTLPWLADATQDLRYAQPLFVLMSCAVLVLLIACVNIANLLLSQGAARQKEIATRLALGAGRGRLVRQLCTESLLIAFLGATVGFVLAGWGANLLAVWRPWGGSTVLEGGLDWRVFSFCGAMALCTGVLFGLAPALRASRTPLAQATSHTTGPAAAPFARVLVVVQVALALVLLVAAGLFAGTLRNLHAVDKGFNADSLLIFRVQPQLNGYAPTKIATSFIKRSAVSA